MSKEIVILLHGILRSDLDMMPLALYLRQKGYEAHAIKYPSREKDLEDLTHHLHDDIQQYVGEKKPTLHFVTHSMGGLLARYYIHNYRPKNLGKVVMIGTPNQGSEAADFLMESEYLSPIFKKIFGPAGQQLGTKHEYVEHDIDYPLGIIAGSQSINPLAPWMLTDIVNGHDGVVPIDSTKIEGMTDHITIQATHTFMTFSPEVISQAAHFLKHTKFNHG